MPLLSLTEIGLRLYAGRKIMYVILALVLMATYLLAGCSGSFLGNPSKQSTYQQPDLRQDSLTTMEKAEKSE